MEDLKFLIKAKFGSIAKASEVTGISVDTINRRLKDHDWRMTEADALIKALNIPPKLVYVYFFEPLLELDSKKVTV